MSCLSAGHLQSPDQRPASVSGGRSISSPSRMSRHGFFRPACSTHADIFSLIVDMRPSTSIRPTSSYMTSVRQLDPLKLRAHADVPLRRSRSVSAISPINLAILVFPEPLAPVSNNGRGRSDTAIRRRYDKDPSTSLSTPAIGERGIGCGLESAYSRHLRQS